MIVHRGTGLVIRFLFGAILDAVEHSRLPADDRRILALADWISRPVCEVCPVCGLDLMHSGRCERRWWR